MPTKTSVATKRMCVVTVDQDVCKGCGLCESACPRQLMQRAADKINAKGYHPALCADEGECIGCGLCGLVCPDSAITVERE